MKKLFLLFLLCSCCNCYYTLLDLSIINQCISDCSTQNGGLDHISIMFPPHDGKYICTCKNGYEKSYRANTK